MKAITHIQLAPWLFLAAFVLFFPAVLTAEPLPVGNQPEPVAVPHFPDKVHAVVWRNWQLVEPARLARVLGTTEEKINALAAAIGLPAAEKVPSEWRRRGYITVVRRNWHLLPYEQLLGLIDLSADELATPLREDDFLFVKLGSSKPRCLPVRYQEPDEKARKMQAEIRQAVDQYFGKGLTMPGEPPFHFVKILSKPDPMAVKKSAPSPADSSLGLRFIYSYFGSFGDPLAHPELDPYPDGLLARLADQGINGVWLHVVLRQLVPESKTISGLGGGHETRLENLRRLVARARRHGIEVLLYMNEPRAMHAGFFAGRPELAGVTEGNYRTLCTSRPEVRQWLENSLAYLFREVPGLGGVFTISASENLTSCASHGQQRQCPRCKERNPDEIIAEVNATIAAGVHRSNPNARVLVWDWGWHGHGDASSIIARLPKDTWLMSVSEWSLPLQRGGVRTNVGEYCLSAAGPGPRALQHWAAAEKAGLKKAAKVAFNVTWELSAVPYLPVLDLVAQHCANLTKTGVEGMMLSWSLGGYPSPNLRIAREFAEKTQASPEKVLDSLALEMFGPDGAPHARKAWTAFSRGFGEYPYHIQPLYQGPQHMGPANLLYGKATGYHATMVGIPYDDLKSWRGPYPAEVYITQMEKVAAGWAEGVTWLEKACATAPADKRNSAAAELRLARAAGLHFASCANQARFIQMRDARVRGGLGKEKEVGLREQMRQILEQEMKLARELYPLARADSRIGFEASNHYYYVPLDLVEKVICCDYLARQLEKR